MRRALLLLACYAAHAHAISIGDCPSQQHNSIVSQPQRELSGEMSSLGVLTQLRGGAGSWSNWWYKTLAKFGLFLKNGKLLVLGLDNAGKSTLLTVLLRNEVVPTAPTHQPVTDVIKVGHMKLRAVDMGGHEIARRMWLQYSHEADGIVYIVDAVDRERFEEAAVELHKLLAAGALPPGAPVLILANKVDLPHAATQEELWYSLGLDELQQQGMTRPIVRAHPYRAHATCPAARHLIAHRLCVCVCVCVCVHGRAFTCAPSSSDGATWRASSGSATTFSIFGDHCSIATTARPPHGDTVDSVWACWKLA